MADSTDGESTRQSIGRSSAAPPTENEEEYDGDGNEIEELYGDERDQYDDEDGQSGENLFGDDMMRFVWIKSEIIFNFLKRLSGKPRK